MAYPQPKVYVAFDDGPYVLSPTWTEITTSVRSMSIDRGRSDDWGTFTGSANVVLNNRERLFDPFYTSGTYYGKLLPRRQIKIEATYGGTTYPVFRGFIDGWPPTWTAAGGDSTVTISCYDAMALLAQVQLPADWSRSYILSTSPRHYYPCDDPIIPFQSGVMTDYGSTQKNLTVQTNATSGNQLATGLVNRSLAGTPDATTDYIATNDPGLLSRVPVFTADNDFAVSFWIIPETPSTSALISGQVCNFNWYVSFASGRFTFGVASGAAVSPNFWSWTTTSQVLNPAEPVHVAVSFNAAAKAAAILINGVDVTGTRTATSTIVLATTADFTTVSMGPIQQIIVWQNAITTTVAQNIIRYSQANFYETTAARVSRIIAETPFSTSLVSAQGTQYIGQITDDAPFAGPELQQTANTEGGVLYVSRAGTLIQLATYGQFTGANAVTSQVTYGQGGVGLGQNVAIQYDGDSMRNIINVNMTGGGVDKETGSVSTSVYGQATQTWNAYMPSITQSTLVGQMLVGFGQYVFPKFQDFEVVCSPDGNWASTMGLDLLERITVKVAPPSGNVITQDLQLNRIQHQVTPGVWRTYLNGSARWASVFYLNRSVLDGPDVLLYAQ
jgi:hypothetical protein